MFYVLGPFGESSKRITKKREKTINRGGACVECRRRKVACSMTRPCASCIKYKCEDRCKDKYQVDNSPESSTKDQQFESDFRQHSGIFEENVHRAVSSIDTIGSTSKSSISSEFSIGNKVFDTDFYELDYAYDGIFQENDTREYGWEEEDFDSDDLVADDVNSLDLTRGHATAYLGAESIEAVLNVLFKLGGHQFDGIRNLRLLSTESGKNKKNHVYSNTAQLEIPPESLSFSYNYGLQLIDAYFEFVHPNLPVVHEATFRKLYESRQKKRSSWLALVYIIFAFGIIVISDAQSTDDIPYFKAARYYLRNLGSGNIEYLQALILMGTHYLHYRNMPNTASALGGAAFKVACGLGLHQELPTKTSSQFTFIELELRRRLWWCLYAQETSPLIYLDRPSMYGGIGVTIAKPQNVDDSTGIVILDRPTAISSKIATMELCEILQKVKKFQCLGYGSLKEEDVIALDDELVKWFENSPSYLRNREGLPLSLFISLTSVVFFYDSIRIILFRSFLLREALLHRPISELSPKRREVIEKCLDLATIAIENLDVGWRPHKISCWGSVWFLFQAVMVPLVMLFSEDRRTESLQTRCQSLVEKSIKLFKHMLPWRNTTERTMRIVQLLFEASKKLPKTHPIITPETTNLDDFLWSIDEQDLMHQAQVFYQFISGNNTANDLQDPALADF